MLYQISLRRVQTGFFPQYCLEYLVFKDILCLNMKAPLNGHWHLLSFNSFSKASNHCQISITDFVMTLLYRHDILFPLDCLSPVHLCGWELATMAYCKCNTAGIMATFGDKHFLRWYDIPKPTNKLHSTDGSWSQAQKGRTQQVLKIDTYLQSCNLRAGNSRLLQIFRHIYWSIKGDSWFC